MNYLVVPYLTVLFVFCSIVSLTFGSIVSLTIALLFDYLPFNFTVSHFFLLWGYTITIGNNVDNFFEM